MLCMTPARILVASGLGIAPSSSSEYSEPLPLFSLIRQVRLRDLSSNDRWRSALQVSSLRQEDHALFPGLVSLPRLVRIDLCDVINVFLLEAGGRGLPVRLALGRWWVGRLWVSLLRCGPSRSEVAAGGRIDLTEVSHRPHLCISCEALRRHGLRLLA